MHRQLLAAALASGLSFAAFSADLKEFVGRYVVTDIVGYADISGGEPSAREALGQKLVITPDAVDLGGARCTSKTGLTVKEVDTAPTLLEFYGPITPLDVGLGPRALLLDSERCVSVFKVDAYRVLFSWDGVIVRAIRDYKPPARKARKGRQK